MLQKNAYEIAASEVPMAKSYEHFEVGVFVWGKSQKDPVI
jgi:hypothetical protein